MPQMPMSRAAFGYIGNYLPAFLASLLFVGYFTTTNIVGAETVQQIWHSAPYDPSAIILGIVAILLTIVGYNLVHSIERYMSAILGIIFIGLTIGAFVHGMGPSHTTTVHGKAFWEAVALEFMVIFSFTASWAPYASDFSRYLPADTPSSKPYGWSFIGMLAGTTWMNLLGVYLGTLADKGGILPSVRTTTHGFADVVYIAIILGGLMVCVINAYSAALSSITWDFPLKRVPTVVLVGAIGTILSISFGGPKFEPSVEKFLYLVAYFITPWLAIVIIDFWVLNRGGKDYPPVGEFYKRDGVFGGIRWPGLLAFLIGVGVSVPFMATVLYTGPIGKAWGDADVSYGISAVVASIVFYTLRKLEGSNSRVTAPPSTGEPQPAGSV
jgi:NCS1 family nucleobase:cation symporter-1